MFTNLNYYCFFCIENGADNGVGEYSLQEKYQRSKYYNGFDVFGGNGNDTSRLVNDQVNATTSSGNLIGGSMSLAHHSCGDDSPPPTITSYTGNYLDGIPNTGVIRYDDASFLKNLIPGQKLNNEVFNQVILIICVMKPIK